MVKVSEFFLVDGCSYTKKLTKIVIVAVFERTHRHRLAPASWQVRMKEAAVSLSLSYCASLLGPEPS